MHVMAMYGMASQKKRTLRDASAGLTPIQMFPGHILQFL